MEVMVYVTTQLLVQFVNAMEAGLEKTVPLVSLFNSDFFVAL